MLEDKLEHDERLRLECLAQANVTSHGQSAEVIVQKAREFEQYVTGKEATS